MMEEKQVSKACFYYEMFMERAYGKYEPIIPGFHACEMRSLIVAENAKIILVSTVDHFEKQLLVIKKYMEAAIDQYTDKHGVSKELKNELLEMKRGVRWAVSSEELMEIVLRVIGLTETLPIERK